MMKGSTTTNAAGASAASAASASAAAVGGGGGSARRRPGGARLVNLVLGATVLLSLATFNALYHAHMDYLLTSSALFSLLQQVPLLGPLFRRAAGKLPSYPLTLWSSDFHISPVQDVKAIVAGYKVKVIDKSLSAHCYLTGTCEKDLRVITAQNGIKLSPCPNALRRDFYNAYHADKELTTADAILCTHAASMCELFMPLGKPLIVVASTRYEIGRHEKGRWQTWNDNLRRIAARRGNVVAANNRYDQEYLMYFTGLEVKLLPSLVPYIQERYRPTREEILLGPARGVAPTLHRQLMDAIEMHNTLAGTPSSSSPSSTNSSSSSSSSSGSGSGSSTSSSSGGGGGGGRRVVLKPIRALYEHYSYADLAAHPAVVLLPYQVSFMSFFEMYRMGIPIYAPSPELLASWHIRYQVLSERSWMLVFGSPQPSALPRHPDYKGPMTADPNEEHDYQAVLQWVRLADFYTYPHILLFPSLPALASMLAAASSSLYLETSSRMRLHQQQQEEEGEYGVELASDCTGQRSF